LPYRSEISEAETVQNPALGAYALWRFGLGHQLEGGTPPPMLATFLVLPLTLHRETLEVAAGTLRGSGIGLFAAKLGDPRERLLAVNDRAVRLRLLTLQSLSLGVDIRLLSIDYRTGAVRSNGSAVSLPVKYVSESTKPIFAAAEKLGHWVARAGLVATANLLRIEF
jgi:hypothetical protein